MKKLIFTMLILATATMSFTTYSSKPDDNANEVEIPEKVKKILETKCMGCHSKGGNSLKARMKLKLDELSELSTGKLINKLEEVAEEIEEGKMPPEKYIKKNPDKQLSEEEAKAIINWAHSTSDQLMQ